MNRWVRKEILKQVYLGESNVNIKLYSEVDFDTIKKLEDMGFPIHYHDKDNYREFSICLINKPAVQALKNYSND